MYIANKDDSYKKGFSKDDLLSQFDWNTEDKKLKSGLTETYLNFQGKRDTISYMKDTYKSEFRFRLHILERVEELLHRNGWSFYQIIH